MTEIDVQVWMDGLDGEMPYDKFVYAPVKAEKLPRWKSVDILDDLFKRFSAGDQITKKTLEDEYDMTTSLAKRTIANLKKNMLKRGMILKHTRRCHLPTLFEFDRWIK